IGQVVTYVVTGIVDEAVQLKISLTGNRNEPTVTGLAAKYSADLDQLNVSQMGTAIVCQIDFDKKALLVFLQPQPSRLVRQVKTSQKDNHLKNVKTGQTIKGTVVYTSKQYVLAVLSGHAPGVLAFIPI